MILYHGSKRLIKKPMYGVGNPKNDYGLGFYMTEHIELAKEWGCFENSDGFANMYRMDLSGLSVLQLTQGDYNILNWLSILLDNREFIVRSDLAQVAKAYLLQEFLPQYETYDVIIGYRADDSYFSFANAFLNNGISLRQLEKAMLLGNLGEQVVLKSQQAFEQLEYTGLESAPHIYYYPKKMTRDRQARAAFFEQKAEIDESPYMIDILRERWRADDERLQRIVCR